MSFIEFKNVSYTYNKNVAGAEVLAVNDFSLSINKGEFVALVGHNGSGKSTLAKLSNGLILPQSGTVTVNGLDTKVKANLYEIRKSLGVVFQNPDNQMIATIIEDDIAFGPENLGVDPKEISERVDWALDLVGMGGHRKGTPHRLSGGQKQRIAIAGILAIKPQAIILDEATAMLDPIGREEVMAVAEKLRKEQDMTVIMITHFMEEANRADRIVVMNAGSVMADGGHDIFFREKELEAIGLDVPPIVRISNKLRENGFVSNKGIFDLESLAEELCR